MESKILALNFGSTSSKIAYFEGEQMILKETLEHSGEELQKFPDFWSQQEYRTKAINQFLEDHGIDGKSIDLFACWGGHCRPVTGGIYRITDEFLKQVRSGVYGNHPCDIAPFVAAGMAGKGKPAVSIDPPTIDEFSTLARYTGIPEIKRKSRMQTLNQKAIAKKYAADHGKAYEDCNLIVVHMGGGISVVVHENGQMVDANNGLDGDGPFAVNRAGTVPAGDLVDLCFDSGLSKQEIKRKITGQAGIVAYLGENDVRTVEKRISMGDEKAKEVYDAMLYQVAKQIGASAAVTCGKVDAILLTGGIAHSDYVKRELERRVGFLAPICAYPGELEMQSLGAEALRALRDPSVIKEVPSV